MVISGKPRGNATQLADYLLAMGANERVTILEADGRANADREYFRDLLYSMELNSELTKSPNSVYHAFINPDPEETGDRVLSMEDWQRSADILTQQLGYEDQRRVIVLHQKNNHTHAHIVFERYDHERGVMKTYEDNYQCHDKARQQMEAEFGHKPTPQKNPNRASHKKTLTELWRQSGTGAEFIKLAQEQGYRIAKGTDRPFRVIDENGVSFDLVRMLEKGINTKEVKQRLGDIVLPNEKEAIANVRAGKTSSKDHEPTKPIAPEATTNPAQNQQQLRDDFIEKLKATKEKNKAFSQYRDWTISALLILRVVVGFKGLEARPQKSVLRQFSENKISLMHKPEPYPDKAMGFIEAAQYYKPK